jgi:hypothetical protein
MKFQEKIMGLSGLQSYGSRQEQVTEFVTAVMNIRIR